MKLKIIKQIRIENIPDIRINGKFSEIRINIAYKTVGIGGCSVLYPLLIPSSRYILDSKNTFPLAEPMGTDLEEKYTHSEATTKKSKVLNTKAKRLCLV